MPFGKRRFQRIAQPALARAPGREPIDDHIQGRVARRLRLRRGSRKRGTRSCGILLDQSASCPLDFFGSLTDNCGRRGFARRCASACGCPRLIRRILFLLEHEVLVVEPMPAAVLSDLDFCLEIDEPPVENRTNESVLAQCGRHLFHARIARNGASEGDHIARAPRQRGEGFGGALRAFAADLAAALAAKRMPDLGKQQPQIIVRLRGGAHGRSARSAGVLAGHGNGGRNAVDPLGLRPLQPLQELSRVGRKTLNVAALSLGVKRIERQAALAAAAQSAEDDQRAAGNIEVDRFQVVNPNAPQRNMTGNTHGQVAEARKPPMTARIGFSFFSIGSAPTPKFSRAVAPNSSNEPLGAKITGHGTVPSNPSI